MQQRAQQQQKAPDQDQTRERWEALVAKRLAEDVPEQQVVQELVSKGADIHLARDFVRRIAEKGPEPKSEPQVKEAAATARLGLPIDVTIGLVLAAAGLIVTLLLYVMDTRSAGVYAGYVALAIGLVLVGRRAFMMRS